MKKLSIGIVGYGFVGKATGFGFSGNNIFIADPKMGTSTADLPNDLDAIFICAPTPTGENGFIDASIVCQVISDLAHLKDTLLVLKSTVTPDIVGVLEEKYSNFVYNPEFLTERNAEHDFVNPIMQVFGGSKENTIKLERIYEFSDCAKSRVFHMTAKEASFVKYGINSFLASKVIFWNQFYDICQVSDVDYENIISAIGHDSRISHSHTTIFGEHDRRGAAGPCFAKDIPALIKYAQKLNCDFSVLNASWNANCDYRNAYPELLDREKEQHVVFTKI